MKRNNGFTLIDLLVALGLVALMAEAFLVTAAWIQKVKSRTDLNPSTTNAVQHAVQAESQTFTETDPILFGHGLYYFRETGTNALRAVSAYLDIHTNLEAVCLAPDVVRMNRQKGDWDYRSDYGAAGGTQVILREKTR